MVLSVDEKSQIQALERTRPGLPLKGGRPATMTHDYTRHGTTTLFAALNVLDGTVIDRPLHAAPPAPGVPALPQRRRGGGPGGQGRARDPGRPPHPRARQGPGLAGAAPARFVFHFTPTACSWPNAVETFFSRLTRRRLRRGSFASIVELQAAINRFVAETNGDPEPFVWAADPHGFLDRVHRAQQASASVH